jgi:glycosyltransferase involved in cell wall biosynthesis
VRIALVTDFYYPWIGGPSTVIRNLGHGLAARGHSVFLLAPSETGKERDEMDGPMQVHRARTVPVPFGYKLRVAANPLSATRTWLSRVQPDVVHVHHPFPLGTAAIRAARRAGIPLAATNHTIPECSLWGMRNLGPGYRAACVGFGQWIMFLLRNCDAVATPTDTAAGALRALGYRRPIRTISNGIDIERFQPRPPRPDLRSALGLDDRPVVLYTGRLDAEKEMDVWLRAAAIVARSVDVQFLVGGNGSERARLEAMVPDLGLHEHVRFGGYLHDKDFPHLYNLADVYCITSRVELQSISTLEAIASGIPCVGVRGGALPELIHDEENGSLCPPGDEQAIADALLALLNDPAGRATMGQRSREIAVPHALEDTLSAYELFLGETAGRA